MPPVAADNYGGIHLPVDPPKTLPDSVTDPFLEVTLDYLRAILNAKMQKAWDVVAPGGTPVVKTVNANDPEEVDFNTKYLPALYCWRAGSSDQRMPDHLAEDYWVLHDTVCLFWIMPMARQAFRAFREQMTAGVVKAVHAAIELGRDPVWVRQGDTDPQAKLYGSVYQVHAGTVAVSLVKWEDRVMKIDMGQGAEPGLYPACLMTLEVEELFQENLDKPIFAPLGAGGLDLTLTEATGTLVTGHRII